MRNLVAALLLSWISPASWAAAPLCEYVFQSGKIAEEFDHYRQVFALEDFTLREKSFALDLISQTRVGTESFMSRYKDLQLLTSKDIALAATPEALLKLTAASLQKRFETSRVQSYLGTVLLETKRAQGYDDSFRLKVPHRITLALTEIAILSGKSPGEVAITYVDHLKTAGSASLESPLPPLDQALEATRAEFLR